MTRKPSLGLKGLQKENKRAEFGFINFLRKEGILFSKVTKYRTTNFNRELVLAEGQNDFLSNKYPYLTKN